MSKSTGPKNNKNQNRKHNQLHSTTNTQQKTPSRYPLDSLGNNLQQIHVVPFPQITPNQLTQIDPMFGTFLHSFQKQVSKINSFYSGWIERAKNHNAKQRCLNVQFFSAENQFNMERDFQHLIESVETFYSNQRIAYFAMEAALQHLKLNNSSPEILAQKMKETEKFLLSGYEKVNVWHTLILEGLKSYEPGENELSKEEMKKKLIIHLFPDLIYATSSLIQRFLNCQLTEHHYYFYYKIINEKIDLLKEYGPI